MRQLVGRLLNEGRRSIRLMALFSLQLVKILTSHPVVLPLYADVYLDLLLFNVWPCDQPEATCEVTSRALTPLCILQSTRQTHCIGRPSQ